MSNENRIDKPRFCLLGASFATTNMGVSALTAGIIECIVYNKPEAEITLLDYEKEKITYKYKTDTKEIPIQLLNIRFSKKIYLKNNIVLLILLSILVRLIPIKKIRELLVSKNLCLDYLSRANVVASIAGGDSFSDIYGLGRLLYVSLPQLLVLFLKKKLILLPQTIGPFKGKLAKIIGCYILDRAAIVYSRDHKGVTEAANLMHATDKSQKIRFCHDVGFAVKPVLPVGMEPGILSFVKENADVIGLNVSGLLFMGGYTKKNMFGLNIDYKKMIYDLINFLIDEMGMAVLLVPHVFGAATNIESDSAVCQKIYDELKMRYEKKLFVISGSYNQSEIKYIIGLCKFFIGSRMHACIAALSQCIPTIGIAYSDKFKGVFETVGAAGLVADPRTMGIPEILDTVRNALNDRQNVREDLQRCMPGVKESIFEIFKDSITADS